LLNASLTSEAGEKKTYLTKESVARAILIEAGTLPNMPYISTGRNQIMCE